MGRTIAPKRGNRASPERASKSPRAEKRVLFFGDIKPATTALLSLAEAAYALLE